MKRKIYCQLTEKQLDNISFPLLRNCIGWSEFDIVEPLRKFKFNLKGEGLLWAIRYALRELKSKVKGLFYKMEYDINGGNDVVYSFKDEENALIMAELVQIKEMLKRMKK